jgi:hypothetical protein
MRLADDDIRGVLARAVEIQSTGPVGDALQEELESVILAAEEVGLARSAVERALRERFRFPVRPPAVGDLTFAKSANDKFYVAEVLSAAPDGIRVRFLSGGEHTVTLDEIRPCSFLPGERVMCQWPWWGPWNCIVVSYDASQRRITASDGWGDTRVFSIDEVWLNAQPKSGRSPTRARVYAKLIGAGATAGAIIGSIITALILG